MKVSDFIAQNLAERGVTTVFEVAGGMISHLLDSIHAAKKIKLVSVHHEQAAGFAADAVGRVTGIPGVAMATSGPGATNLLTGIASCYFDSSPAVFITGQVNTHEQKGQRPIRQLGFQETDIVSMAQPVTKAAVRVSSAAEVPELLDRAFAIAVEGRPGPVLLDIPMDVQRQQIDVSPFAPPPPRPPKGIASASLAELRAALSGSKQPIILAGGGIHAAGCRAAFRQFVESIGVPVVASLQAVDVLPFGHPLRVGFIGSYGNRWANMALGTCDLLVVLGSRLDIRQTGADVASFSTGKKIIHVDCEPGEINNRVTGVTAILADLRDFFASATDLPKLSCADWIEHILKLKAAHPDIRELSGLEGINPNAFMHELSSASREAGTYFVDVGSHQMWAAQSLELEASQRFITSAGLGSMGFALPAAMGAACLSGARTQVVIAGDGGMQMNIQELQTVVHNSLPIKIVVINNGTLGMIRQFQDSYFGSRYQSTWWGYSAPNFAAVANAYGIEGHSVEDPSQVAQALQWLWRDPLRPQLLQVAVSPHANAYPKLAFGKPITEMEPESKPLDMEGT